ncbi:hypothetical protein D0Z08_14370 [Nocardioides immobilis]|uniref:Peptidase n=1 Tax=Nocardioides immobilis TaxID=2049295 RepID=A0A417Y1S4_9ACTN|nr:hypothetical protein [Nocardioides immobilis]RHW26507.1 hypothetical protein D0Z08_14370 [Nocardioides immobilis]
MRTVARAAAVAALALGVGAWTPYGAAGAEPVDLGGQPVAGGTGSTDRNEPTSLTAGLWRDTLGTGTDDEHYFVYERQMRESTVHVGLVGVSQDPAGDGIGLQVLAGETDCGSNTDDPGSYAAHSVFGIAVDVGPADIGDHQSECLRAPSLAIIVNRGYSSSTQDLPIAIKIVEEAPVVELDPENPGLPEPDDVLSYPPPSGASPEDLAGGSSFDDAPAIDPTADGVTVTTTVAEGSEVLYRVPVDWGQQVVATARVPAMDPATQERTGGSGPYVDLRIIDPLRAVVGEADAEATTTGSYGTERAELSRGTYPLRYLNRFADQSPLVPGDFWVAFAVQALPADAGRDALDVPVEVTIAVVAGAGEGAPEHQATVQAPGGGAGPDGYAAETPYLVGDGEFSAVASGNPFTPEMDDEAWWGPRRGLGVGVGVISLACCAVGAVWLTRRRAR